MKPQPTPEMCRLYHGIDCRRCAGSFELLDKMCAIQDHYIADQWRRDFEEGQQSIAKFRRRWGS